MLNLNRNEAEVLSTLIREMQEMHDLYSEEEQQVFAKINDFVEAGEAVEPREKLEFMQLQVSVINREYGYLLLAELGVTKYYTDAVDYCKVQVLEGGRLHGQLQELAEKGIIELTDVSMV